ncbi:hypothetical protein GQ53DRAFT_881754 [Thozetella sp. PMI_491]|nr:hypothetical protein GQ53DRAFT_881754 [Thozetella sp. PMI_491]
MQSLLSLSVFITAAAASPIVAPDPAPALADRHTLSAPLRLSLRALNVSNLDILIPDDDGVLLRPDDNFDILKYHEGLLDPDILDSDSDVNVTDVEKRQELGQVGFEGLKCQSPRYLGTNKMACSQICEGISQIAAGTRKRASSNIHCTTGSCSVMHSDTVSVTKQLSFSLGGKIAPQFSLGEQTKLTVELSFGFSYGWAETTSTSDSYRFNPTQGDTGYIVFLPFMLEICGPMTITQARLEGSGTTASSTLVCGPRRLAFEPMFCQAVPLTDSSNRAIGVYSFCHIDTRFGCAD